MPVGKPDLHESQRSCLHLRQYPTRTIFLIGLTNNQGYLGTDDHIPITLDLKMTTIFIVAFTLNQWLADGLLVRLFQTQRFRGLT